METQALATTSQEVATISENKLISYLKTLNIATPLNQKETEQFIEIAQAWGLNPFKREIYVSKYGGTDGFSIIVGFEVYLKRAERSGKLDGWEVEFKGEGDSLSCVVTIYRKDWKHPFKHEAFYSECVQKTKEGHVTKFWKKAKLMTRKVAISQAFRMAFPDELGGMPYTPDEMGVDVQDTSHEVVQERQPYEQAAKQNQPLEAQVVQSEPPVKMTKRESAIQMKINSRIKDHEKSIGMCEDDKSFDDLEGYIANDDVLPTEEKVVLIKMCIIVRTNKVFNPVQAEVVKTRIAGWAKTLGVDNTTALLNDLVDQAKANGMIYENKTFKLVDQYQLAAEELTEA